VPTSSLSRHAAINLFLKTYRELWLDDENNGQEVLIDHLTVRNANFMLALFPFFL